MIKLILIEDDLKIREYLSALITGSGEFELLGAFESAEGAMDFISSAASNDIEMVLTDIELPGQSGIDFISWLKRLRTSVPVMVLSVYDDADRVFRALKAGASGYVLKNTPSAKLIDALLDLKQGGSPMSGQIARMVVSSFQHMPDPGVESLSVREQEVLRWLSQGYRYQEIADKLFISIETVRTHVRNIYEKLHANNRKEAMRNAGIV